MIAGKLFRPLRAPAASVMLRSMCNRYRVSAKQMEVAKQFGADIDRLMPEPERLRPPELFPKRMGWVVRTQDGARLLDVMQWGVPLNGKPITNVRNLQSPFWRSMLKDSARRCLVPVILHPEDYDRWLGGHVDDVCSLAAPFPSQLMDVA